MYKGTQLENSQAKPTIYVEDISDSQLKLQVTHNKPLEKVTYSWNNEEAVDLNAKGKEVLSKQSKFQQEKILYMYMQKTKMEKK